LANIVNVCVDVVDFLSKKVAVKLKPLAKARFDKDSL
jgi:hypothetical protein